MEKEFITATIPENYKRLLERVNFERKNITDNAAFMLSHHVNDQDPSYLDTNEWKEMVESTYNSVEQYNLTMMGVVMALLGVDNYPNHFQITRDMGQIVYQKNEA